MRRIVAFGAACAAIVMISALVLLTFYAGVGERRALGYAAIVAVVVQIVSFTVVKSWVGRNVIAGWGLGIAVRFVAFILWTVVVVRWLALPSAAAMVSMALYLFVSTLVEPFFLES